MAGAIACGLAAMVAVPAVIVTATPVTPSNFIYDVNEDGVVDLFDLVSVAVKTGREIGDQSVEAKHDVNGDGKITLSDARLIVSALVGNSEISAVESLEDYASPSYIVADRNSSFLYTVESTAGQIAKIDSVTGKVVERMEVGGDPNGMVLSDDGMEMYITYDGAESGVKKLFLNTRGEWELTELLETGHTPMSPILSKDGTKLYVANRFSSTVSQIDTENLAVTGTVDVGREPVSMDMTSDGMLFIANHAAEQPSNASYVASKVRVVNTNEMSVVKEITLNDGATGVRQIHIAPDETYAYVSHLTGRYWVTTTQLDKGWMNSNGFSIIDVKNQEYLTTVQLDDMTEGAANPWGITTTEDGKYLAVTTAGTHEVTLVDRAGMHQKITDVQTGVLPRKDSKGEVISTDLVVANGMEDIPDAVGFIDDFKERIDLSGNGPRAVVAKNDKLFVANYFSDTVDVVNLQETDAPVEQIALSTKLISENAVREGEMRFNDASVSYQNWQSCASCHPDTRADSISWDNLNDGVGNPKNTKSMLYTHYTGASMITGIRADAETAVRAGMKHIQFYGGSDAEDIAVQIDTYLKALEPEISPYLVDGKLTPAAEAGKTLYEASCIGCHPTAEGAYTTDNQKHQVPHIPEDEVGLVTQEKIKGIEVGAFDTPSLNESWRTAPYLYDGRATTMEEVIRIHFGSNLSEEQVAQLAEYVLTL